MTDISSAGSLENIKLLRDNQAQFAILQGPFGAWSWDGEGPVSSPQSHLRSVSALWKNVEHFVLLSELSSTGTMHDLNLLSGERYVLGARNSGAEQTGRFILDSLGIDYQEKFTLAYMGYGPTQRHPGRQHCRYEYPGGRAGELHHSGLCSDGRTHDHPELEPRVS